MSEPPKVSVQVREDGSTWVEYDDWIKIDRELSEVRAELAQANEKLSAPRIELIDECPAGHDRYWRTQYGHCMACRAESAEAKIKRAQNLLRELVDAVDGTDNMDEMDGQRFELAMEPGEDVIKAMAECYDPQWGYHQDSKIALKWARESYRVSNKMRLKELEKK